MNGYEANIQHLLNQRYPFIFIDSIKEFNNKKEITILKKFTCNDYYCQIGSFEIPQFVIIETMGQASELLIRLSYEMNQKSGYLASIQEYNIYKTIDIPCQVRIENNIVYQSIEMFKTKSTVIYNNEKICEGFLIHVFK
jgi:3-hydroxyacyl-[acyl-carrier-protein] dehydratase